MVNVLSPTHPVCKYACHRHAPCSTSFFNIHDLDSCKQICKICYWLWKKCFIKHNCLGTKVNSVNIVNCETNWSHLQCMLIVHRPFVFRVYQNLTLIKQYFITSVRAAETCFLFDRMNPIRVIWLGEGLGLGLGLWLGPGLGLGLGFELGLGMLLLTFWHCSELIKVLCL